MRRYVIALSIACAALCAQTVQPVFPIAGTAVDAASGNPMRHLRVVLALSSETTSELASQITGDNGSFHFEAAAGKYQLRAERNGLPSQTYGASRLSGGFGIALVTGPGHVTDSLRFQIYPPSAITGKVIDDAGEPVESALVQLVRSYVYAGRKRTAMYAWRYTNDLGEYRIGNLPASSYYLAVTGTPWYTKNEAMGFGAKPLQPSQVESSFAPLFYPNTADARAASAIAINEGQEMTANFTLKTTPGYDVSVQVEGKSTPSQNVRGELLAEGPEGARLYSRIVTTLYGDTWQIPGVPPGRYTIRALGSGDAILGSKSIEVTSANLEVQMELMSPSVAGTVVVEGGDKQLLRKVVVTLDNESAKTSVARSVKEDGTFTFPAVFPGQYRVHVLAGKALRVKSVAAPDGTVKDGVVDIGPEGLRKLSIVADARAGRVKGFVYRGEGRVPGMLAILAPTNRSSDHSDYRGFRTDSDGSFDFEAVPVGEYRLFAVEDPDFEYSNPAVVIPLLARGKLVRVQLNAMNDERLDVQ